MSHSNPIQSPGPENPERRTLLTRLSTIAMFGGLAAGYGGLAAMAGRYVYPARPREQRWLYVARIAQLRPGDSLVYRTPLGETVAVARQGAGEGASDFVALSSVCPHLGCQVHWQPQHARFFCPCHNGVFSPTGTPVSGPPAEANTPLPQYPLRVEQGLLYIQVPTEGLAQRGEVLELRDGSGPEPRVARSGRIDAPGHDPCLAPENRPWEV